MIKYRSFKVGLLSFVAMTLLFCAITIPVYLSQKNSLENTISETVKSDLNSYGVNIDNQVAYVTSNILLLEDIITNREVLIKDGESIDFSSKESKEALELDLIDWMTIHSVYDQIRIIGIDGVEVLRVNSNNGDPIVVDDSDLQDKSNRYYFENAIILPDDTLYLSKIDLNVENGEIEYIDGNFKEMLRIGSTIYNSDDEKIGMVIVNYFADNLFHDVETYESAFTSFEIINEDGYFLHSENKSIEYGFMFNDKQDVTFDNYYGFDITMGDISSTQIVQETNFRGQFTYLVVNNLKMENAIMDLIGRDINVYSDNGDILLYGRVLMNETNEFQTLNRSFIILSTIVMFLILILSRMLDEIFFGREQRLKVLEYTSNHDMLTGLLNRKSVFSSLEYLSSRKETFVILFIDFDGFKLVNDTYGHNIGDLLLIEGSKRMQNITRETDIVARLGGDEFLICLKGIDSLEVAKSIANKVETEVTKEYSFKKVTCNVGVSIGIALHDGTKELTEVINTADNLMYQIKEEHKSN